MAYKWIVSYKMQKRLTGNNIVCRLLGRFIWTPLVGPDGFIMLIEPVERIRTFFKMRNVNVKDYDKDVK